MEMVELKSRLMAEGEKIRNIPVPREMEQKLNTAVHRSLRARRSRGTRIAVAAAAAALILMILPNTGENMACAMGNLPVVGRLFRAVTFMNYQYEDERFNADVDVPQIVIDQEQPREPSGISGELDEAVKQVNLDIEKITEQLVAQFSASVAQGESYDSLEIRHETVTDNERYYALKLFIYRGAGSGTQSYKIYTIDKLSGQRVRLGDLFTEGSGYRETISENIREQMRAAMAADGDKSYWVDMVEKPEMNWAGVEEEQDFYFDQAGNLVLAFDEYEVAPGYMGAQEFTVDRSVYEEMLK